MGRVFITGANGFIGRALTVRLQARGDDVAGVDVVADPARDVLAGDISRAGTWQRAVTGCDTVVHTAAVVSNAATAEATWRVNVLGTKHVVDAAVHAGVRRMVHLSSVRAFGDVDFPDGVTEEHPVRPDGNAYVDTKVAAEQVVLQAHAAGRVEVAVVRPGDVYGPGSRPWTVTPVQMIAARRFLLPAMGRGVFSPVFVEDLVDGLLAALDVPGAAGQVLTVGGDRGVTCADFFGRYHAMLGRRGPLVVPTGVALALATASSLGARLARRETEVNAATVRYLTRRGTYSVAKAHEVLGYAPRVDLDHGMELTRRWLADVGLVPASSG